MLNITIFSEYRTFYPLSKTQLYSLHDDVRYVMYIYKKSCMVMCKLYVDVVSE